MIGAVIVPFVLEGKRVREQERHARAESLRRLVPSIIEFGLKSSRLSDDVMLASSMRCVGELETWLKPNEWQIGRMAVHTVIVADRDEDHAEVVAAFAQLAPAWLRGDLSAAEAADRFTRLTGIAVERWALN